MRFPSVVSALSVVITMKRSDGRILTTHAGSLPRPEGLVEMLGAVSRGEAVDEAALAEAARKATEGVVRAQAGAGVDVINGEDGLENVSVEYQWVAIDGGVETADGYTVQCCRSSAYNSSPTWIDLPGKDIEITYYGARVLQIQIEGSEFPGRVGVVRLLAFASDRQPRSLGRRARTGELCRHGYARHKRYVPSRRDVDGGHVRHIRREWLGAGEVPLPVDLK